jgi:exocyst complex protein 7
MILTTRCTDIDRALLKIDEVASSQDGVAVDEGMILRGYVAVRLKLGGRGMTE